MSGADPHAKLAAMCQHPFFEGISPEICTRLAGRVISRRYPSNAIIFAKGDPGDALSLISSGAVRIGVRWQDGRDVIFRLLHEGEFFGEIALLDGRPRTADAYAHTDCEILSIYRRDLIPIIESYPSLMWRLLQILCSRMRKTTEQVEDLMFVDLSGRLARTLIELASDAKDNNRIRVTQSEIAKIAGLSRETTNKQLRAWAKRSWIALGRREILLLNAVELSKIAPQPPSG